MFHVKQYGWSQEALVAGSRDLGMSPSIAGLLPRREGHLVEHFISTCNTDLAKEMETRHEGLQEMGSPECFAMVIKMRLQMVEPHLSNWSQALAIAVKPKNFPHSSALLSSMVDEALLFSMVD
eukprot:gene23543-9067_t